MDAENFIEYISVVRDNVDEKVRVGDIEWLRGIILEIENIIKVGIDVEVRDMFNELLVYIRDKVDKMNIMKEDIKTIKNNKNKNNAAKISLKELDNIIIDLVKESVGSISRERICDNFDGIAGYEVSKVNKVLDACEQGVKRGDRGCFDKLGQLYDVLVSKIDKCVGEEKGRMEDAYEGILGRIHKIIGVVRESDIKEIVEEILNEIGESGYRLTPKEKKLISNEMGKYKELGGNIKFNRQGGKGVAIGIISKALSAVGFELDMVTGDILLGEKGNRLLSFSRSGIGEMPSVPVVNSRISFSWENLSGDQFNPNIEVIAYVT